MEHFSSSSKRQKQRDNAKTIWMITYGAGCSDITHDLIKECGLDVLECYTIEWRESKYTLVHLASRQRRISFENKIKDGLSKYRIILSEITGYESVTGNCMKTELDTHPGFKKMVELINNEDASIHCWDQGKNIYSDVHGIFWTYLEVPPSQATFAQLKRMVSKYQPMARELESLKPEYESAMNRLSDCEARLEIAVQRLKNEREYSEKITAELSEKLKECTELKTQLLWQQQTK